MPEHAAHRDDLAFVMEGMGQNMMENERWSANGKALRRDT